MAKEKKTKKHDTFIDMTAMSDMTVLLLTFFMLTATFLPLEPVTVTTPQSVSETKIPENDNLMILVDPAGKVYLNITGSNKKGDLLESMGQRFGISFNEREKKVFEQETTFVTVPMKEMKKYLNSADMAAMNEMASKSGGVPNDSINGMELELWVQYARGIYTKDEKKDNLTLSIKADQNTPYEKVDNVTKSLIRIKENRYNLITSLTEMPVGL